MSCDDDFDPEKVALDSAVFFRRVIELEPGQELSRGLGAWRGAILFLTEGEVELECVGGQRRRFGAEAVLCLTSTACLLRNSGTEPARLIAISRRNYLPRRSG